MEGGQWVWFEEVGRGRCRLLRSVLDALCALLVHLTVLHLRRSRSAFSFLWPLLTFVYTPFSKLTILLRHRLTTYDIFMTTIRLRFVICCSAELRYLCIDLPH